MAFPPNFQPAGQAKPKTKYDMATQTHKVIRPKSKGKKPNPFAKGGTPPVPPTGKGGAAPTVPF